jgi:hypothetical protein
VPEKWLFEIQTVRISDVDCIKLLNCQRLISGFRNLILVVTDVDDFLIDCISKLFLQSSDHLKIRPFWYSNWQNISGQFQGYIRILDHFTDVIMYQILFFCADKMV